MMQQTYWLDTRDKPGLLTNLMKYLAGNAHILLQGNLDNCDFSSIPRVFGNNNLPLHPLINVDDGPFVILRLEPETIRPILARVLPQGRIVYEIGYILIEKNGRLEFMAGDNFHNECISVGPGISEDMLKELVKRGILRGYTTDEEAKRKR